MDGQLDRASVKEHSLPDHRRSFRRTAKTLPHFDQMQRPYEVWYSSRHVLFRWTEDRFFQSAHSVGMHLDAGGVQAYHIHFYLNVSNCCKQCAYLFFAVTLLAAILVWIT